MSDDYRTESDIGFFISSMGDGGAQRTIANLASGLSRRGYVVDILLIRAEGPYLRNLHPEINVVELSSTRALTSLLPLVKYLRQERPAVLFSTMNYLNIIAIWAGLISRTSTNIVIRSATVESKREPEGRAVFVPQLMQAFYRFANKHIALSQSVANDVCCTYGLDLNETSVIYNPVVTDDLLDKATEPVDHPWFDTDVPVILGVGRLSDEKDFSTLIEAFEQVVRSHDAKLVILGKGNKRSELESLVETLCLTDIVSMPGFVDNPYAYMGKADVFALSSRREGFGNVIVEAMACGTPVVSTDCPGGPSEILDDGKYGPLVPVGDTEALAKNISSLLVDPTDATTLRQRAMEFSVDAITEEYASVLFGSS